MDVQVWQSPSGTSKLGLWHSDQAICHNFDQHFDREDHDETDIAIVECSSTLALRCFCCEKPAADEDCQHDEVLKELVIDDATALLAQRVDAALEHLWSSFAVQASWHWHACQRFSKFAQAALCHRLGSSQ